MNIQKKIKYNRVVKSQAMSKWPNQSGLSLTLNNDIIDVESINPKMNDVTSHLCIQIPKESLQEVIDNLKTFL